MLTLFRVHDSSGHHWYLVWHVVTDGGTLTRMCEQLEQIWQMSHAWYCNVVVGFGIRCHGLFTNPTLPILYMYNG